MDSVYEDYFALKNQQFFWYFVTFLLKIEFLIEGILYHCNMFLFLFCSHVNVQLVLGWKVSYGVVFMYSQLALPQILVTVISSNSLESKPAQFRIFSTFPSTFPPSPLFPKERHLRKLNFTPCLILVNSLLHMKENIL